MTINGQILAESSFATYIDKIFTNHTLSNIVEIGTWRGLGSTKVIIDNIIKHNYTNCKFLSLETNKEFFDIAKSNLASYKNYVELIHGSIITLRDIDNYIKKNPIQSLEHVIWLYNDIYDLQTCPNILSMLPDSIDFLLLDGGEFSTYHEWCLLKDRSRFIALDDTQTMKCRLIREEILSASSYKILVDSDDRNGFMFIENTDYGISNISI